MRDSAADITAAIRDGGFANISCVNHTLQLASLKVDAVSDLIKTVKAVVGHFHFLHSKQFKHNDKCLNINYLRGVAQGGIITSRC